MANASDMPAKIWWEAGFAGASDVAPVSKDYTPYIRADLVEPLVEALRKAEELYQVGLLNAPDNLADEVVTLRRAALSSWEAGQ
jgi:hypothetical protein